MQDFWQTFGHKTAKSILEKQLRAQKFAQAYLFSGPESIGKKTLAEEFAQKVLSEQKLASHPDFINLGAAEKVSVEDIRRLISKLTAKPLLGKYTLAILDNAHLMNQSASNAILKTLEEPSPSSIIILISSGRLLPTIISRCQQFAFNPLSFEECAEFAESKGMDFNRQAYGLSGGAPGTWLASANDKQAYSELAEFVDRLNRLADSSVAEKILALQEFSELENENLEKILRAWLFSLKASLAQTPPKYALLPPILRALKQLHTNMNKKFILQQLFLES